MQPRNLLMTVCLLGLAAWLCCLPAVAVSVPPAIRGPRVAVLQVAEGPLQIKILKRDLNIYEGEDILRAQLYDAQLRVVAQLTIPDGGPVRGPGELQSAEMSLPEAVAGMYRLIITGGSDYIYGLETNATRCVLQGEILLNDANLAGQIVFAPPPEAFKISARALHDPGRQQMPLRDQRGELIHQFDLAKTGDIQVLEVPADPNRQGLWTFEIGKLNVRLNLGKPLFWATDPAAWFDAAATRGMLMPYREARNLLPGQKSQVNYEVTNNLGRPAVFEVRTRGDEGLKLSGGEGSWTLQPKERRLVPVTVELAADRPRGRVLQARVTAKVAGEPELQSISGLEVRVGEPALGPLPGPVVLRHFEHENLLFGYSPDYAPNEVYFDLANRPYLRQRTNSMYVSTGLQVLEGSQWVERPFMPAVREAHPDFRSSYGAGGFLGAKVAFDGQGGAYTMMQASLESTRQVLLLFTPDEGRSFQVYDLPGSVFDIEQFTGHNALPHPPPILLYTETRPHPATFASYFDLHLLLPRREGNRLVLGEPLKITDNCLGSCQHSGGPASSVTRDGRTHIVWGEISPDDAPGVPTYVVTYDQATGELSPKVLLGHGPPANDVHNVPAITMDSTGTLHVIIGSHGEAFQYTQSLRPNDSQSGWTPAAPVLSAGYVDEKTPAPGSGRQTYASLVCDPSDTLHIAYRQWRRNVDEYHPGQIYAALSVQSKPRDKKWGPAQPRVIPPVSGYSVYYHKLTIDRSGGLYLSYNYWTEENSYREYFPEAHHHRALQTSADGGKTWKLATTADFAGRVKQ